MGRLIAVLAVLAVCVVALGFYLGWFTVTTDHGTDKMDVNVSVDKNKVRQDEEKAREKVGELQERVKSSTAK